MASGRLLASAALLAGLSCRPIICLAQGTPGFLAGGDAPLVCSENSFEQALAQISAAPSFVEHGFDMASDIMLCQALAARDPKACAAQAEQNDSNCRQSYALIAPLASPFIEPAQAMQACAAGLENRVAKGRAPEFCSDLHALYRSGDPENCARMAALWLPSPNQQAAGFKASCLQNIAGALKIPSCAQANPKSTLCGHLAALKKAVPSKSTENCGGSMVCRALISGSTLPCDKMKAQFVSRFCSIMDVKQEQDFRRSYSYPPYEPGSPLIYPKKLQEEILFRKTYHLAPYRRTSPFISINLLRSEKQFRASNGLPPFKMGDTLLDSLPPKERMKYEKNSPMNKSRRAPRPRPRPQ